MTFTVLGESSRTAHQAEPENVDCPRRRRTHHQGSPGDRSVETSWPGTSVPGWVSVFGRPGRQLTLRSRAAVGVVT